MSDMLDIFPLSPVREWASSLSFISGLGIVILYPDQGFVNKYGLHGHHCLYRFGHPATAGRSVRIQGLNLIAYGGSGLRIIRPASDPHPYFLGASFGKAIPRKVNYTRSGQIGLL